MGSRLEANSSSVRKRIEKHKFENEEGEEYEPSKFGGFNDYFRRKKIKLQNLDAELRSSNDKPPVFRGVVAHVNGYTQPSLNDLHALIVSYGGGFMQYLDGKTTVTHIIASNLTPKKKVEFSRYRIVKPAWVVDSVEAGKLLPWDVYRLVDEGMNQRVLGFDNGKVMSQASTVHGGYKDQTAASWYTRQVRSVAGHLESPLLGKPEPYSQVSADMEFENSGPNSLSSSEPSIQKLKDEDESDAIHTKTSSLDRDVDPIADDVCEYPTPSDARHDIPDLHLSPAAAAVASDCSSDPNPGAHSPHNLDEGNHQEIAAASIPPNSEDEPCQELQNQHRICNNEVMSGADVGDPAAAEKGELRHYSRKANNQGVDFSAEEHNAALLADPKVWKSTVVNPDFLKQYYEESRLHHLSAWKAALKSQIQALAAGKTSSQRGREKRTPGTRRYVLHVDFDSFFAAVSLKKYPQFVEKPVVVAHGNGAGAEIASSNYPARNYGIKNGMWMKHAQQLCPDLKVLPYDFRAYEDASRDFYDAILDTGGIVQSVSIDEALVDISLQCITAGGHDGKGIHEGSIWREQAGADEIASGLREKVKEKTGCAVSVGIGANILLAKVALRKAKPAGQHHIKPEDALDFLGELTMQDLPGIAYSIGGKLEEIGVKYVKDVRQLSKERMISVLGPKTGKKVWDYSRGIDRQEVGDQVVRKSVSAEVNWGIRFVTQEQTDEFIQSLCEELHKRLVTEGVKGKQLTMKIMRRAADAPLDPPKHLGHGKCDTFNKSLILGVATNDQSILGREASSILKGFGFSPGELRGLGVQMTKLEPVKGGIDSPQDSSQKQLQFKASAIPKRSLERGDNAGEEIESPRKSKDPPPHPAAAFARETTSSAQARNPLNTLGTQFAIPSQIDPDVLSELPFDIRSKVLPKRLPSSIKNVRERSPSERSRSTTPAVPAPPLPSHSQIDPETLDALPEDMRTEILAYYARSPQKARTQAVLPQSPRKDRAIKLPQKLTTPTKRRGGLLSRGKNNASTFSTLTQSNFVANARASSSKQDGLNDENLVEEIPVDVLSALPEDIRLEVLAQQRRDRLQKKGGIDFTASKKSRPPTKHPPLAPGQRTLDLPSRPSKPSFTARKFTKLDDLRGAMNAWFGEFKDEGPYAEDVNALVKYLQTVIVEEADIHKATSLVKWLKWIIDEGGGNSWEKPIQRVEAGVQEAMKQRGLGSVQL